MRPKQHSYFSVSFRSIPASVSVSTPSFPILSHPQLHRRCSWTQGFLLTFFFCVLSPHLYEPVSSTSAALPVFAFLPIVPSRPIACSRPVPRENNKIILFILPTNQAAGKVAPRGDGARGDVGCVNLRAGAGDKLFRHHRLAAGKPGPLVSARGARQPAGACKANKHCLLPSRLPLSFC